MPNARQRLALCQLHSVQCHQLRALALGSVNEDNWVIIRICTSDTRAGWVLSYRLSP